jgi:hypothetical protein
MLLPFHRIGVWGNHELGLVRQPTPELQERHGESVMSFFSELKPRLAIDDILFTHGLPSWNPSDPAIYYLGERPWAEQALTEVFKCIEHRVFFAGHFHRWFAATPTRTIPWDGISVLTFESSERYFVIIDAVYRGAFAILDTDAGHLTPHHI